MSLQDKLKRIQTAIDLKEKMEIVYLKPNDEKSRRTLLPRVVGELSYNGKPFLGVQGYCMERQDDRVFRVDRILEIAVL